jgi:hypothetical protein
MNKYQLIHINTLEVTMCEKINKHYVSGDDFHNKNLKPLDFAYHWKRNEIVQVESLNKETGIWICKKGTYCDRYKLKKVIATTNTSLQCPQVVDYVEYLAESNYGTDIDSYRGGKPYDLERDRKQGFVTGYQKHSKTHSLSDEDVLQLIQSLKDYTHESHNILGHDEREPEEFLETFKSTLPTKVYYR